MITVLGCVFAAAERSIRADNMFLAVATLSCAASGNCASSTYSEVSLPVPAGRRRFPPEASPHPFETSRPEFSEVSALGTARQLEVTGHTSFHVSVIASGAGRLDASFTAVVPERNSHFTIERACAAAASIGPSVSRTGSGSR